MLEIYFEKFMRHTQYNRSVSRLECNLGL